MIQLSEDESSDSSDEFLVPANKIDLNSSFFKQSVAKSNPKKVAIQESSDYDSDENDIDYENNVSSAELLSQVLKNFENAQNKSLEVKSESLASTSKAAEQPSNSNVKNLSKEINDLLMQGESGVSLSNLHREEDEEDEEKEPDHVINYAIPEKGVEIHLPGENLLFDRRKKKQRDLQKLLQNKINQRIRSTQVFVHKVGLLCWLSHGFFLNKLANEPDLLGITLSLVSPNDYPKGRADLKYLERFTKWFAGMFNICAYHKETVWSKDILMERVSSKKIYNYIELVLLCAATLRGIGINCRLVISLQPPPLKPKPEQLFKYENDKNDSEKLKTVKKEETNEQQSAEIEAVKDTKQNNKKKSKTKTKSLSPTKAIANNSREAATIANLEARKKAAAILKSTKSKKDEEPTKNNKNERTLRSRKKENNKNDNDNDDAEVKDNVNESITVKKLRSRTKNTEVKATEANVAKNKKHNEDKIKVKELPAKRKHAPSGEEYSDDDSEFSTDDEYVEKKPKKRIVKTENQTIATKIANKVNNKHRKLLSSDDADDEPKAASKRGYNIWIEAYVESEESWISVNVLDQKIHCVSEIYKKASQPVLYTIAWNSVGTVKDVTRRYCPHWLTDTRKKRVDSHWWKQTLSCWKEEITAISTAEDEELLQRELEQPLPKTISECKGHPLYVLTRHLLKFEALYPPDAVPLGHLKTGEAIYSRHCVHTLYSRETWLKRARVVKPAQEAYKVVKSLPKYDKLSGTKIKDQPLELFGKWQTTHYIPPEAKDGKVPRNEYGNVDLFKMCMLPKGTVYLELPGLSRIARKLNIDCAPACTGFQFGCRGALPVFEGFVVCEEYEDTVREAWEEEQIATQKRAKEKREKRIYGNWKKLIKGLLIREKLAAKYNFRDEEDEEADEDDNDKISTAEKLAAAVKKVGNKAAKAANKANKRSIQEPAKTKKKTKSK